MHLTKEPRLAQPSCRVSAVEHGAYRQKTQGTDIVGKASGSHSMLRACSPDEEDWTTGI